MVQLSRFENFAKKSSQEHVHAEKKNLNFSMKLKK
jgi:hypothetical protein